MIVEHCEIRCPILLGCRTWLRLPQCLQPCVGQWVSVACSLMTPDYYQLDWKTLKLNQMVKDWLDHITKWTNLQYWRRNQDNRRIISEVGRLYFEKGIGCLSIAFLICLSIAFLDPPCETILSHSILARGIKSSINRVQRAILRNSDIIEP